MAADCATCSFSELKAVRGFAFDDEVAFAGLATSAEVRARTSLAGYSLGTT